MKTNWIHLVLLSTAMGIGSIAADEPIREPKARARQALALRAVAQSALDELDALALTDEKSQAAATLALTAGMLDEVGTFRSETEGRDAAHEWLASWRRNQFMQRMEEATERAAEHSPLPVEMAKALARATANWERRRNDGAQTFAETALDAVYEPARRQAVAQLRDRVNEEQSYPAYAELDPQIRNLDEQRTGQPIPLDLKVFDELLPWLRDFATTVEPVFEELDPWVSDLAVSLRDEIHRQYIQQLDVVSDQWDEGIFPEDLLTRSELETFMKSKLHDGIPPDPDRLPPVYEPFSAVHHLVTDAAAHWEARRLDLFLADTQPEWAPSGEGLRELIIKEVSAHTDPSTSEALLVEHWTERTGSAVADRYAEQAPHEVREGVQTELRRALDGGGALRPVLRDRIQGVMHTLLPKIREALTADQLQDNFPFLLTEKKLPVVVVEALYDRGRSRVEDIDTALDILAVDAALPALETEREKLLQETGDELVRRLNEQLPEAVSSLRGQIETVRDLESDWMDRLRADVARGRGVDQVLRDWSREWQRRWEDVSSNVPATWRERFERTDKELNKTVRQLYSSVEKEQAEMAEREAAAAELGEKQPDADDVTDDEMVRVDTPAEPPGEEDDMEETGAGAGEDEEIKKGVRDELRAYQGVTDGVLDFTDLANGKSRVLFGAPDGSGGIEVEFDPADVEAALEKITGALRDPLRQVLDSSIDPDAARSGFLFFTRKTDTELRMLLRVQSPSIRHRMSILLRRFMENEIRQWSEETGQRLPVLLWQEDVGDF